MPVKQPPYDEDEDLDIDLLVANKDDVLVDPLDLTVEIARPISGDIDEIEKTAMTRIATGAYSYRYRIPAEWGTYHGTASSDLPAGGRVVEQFDFPVQKPGAV